MLPKTIEPCEMPTESHTEDASPSGSAQVAKQPHAENVRLAEFIKSEVLTRAQVAEITTTTKAHVDQWLRLPDSPNYRRMRPCYLRLLEFELGLRAPSFTRYHRGLK